MLPVHERLLSGMFAQVSYLLSRITGMTIKLIP